MISYLKGTIEHKFDSYFIIEVGGVGYAVNASPKTLGEIRLSSNGEIYKVFTYMSVKEDGVSLFGFLTLEEINMFNLLITVSGVGPKGAVAILSALPPKDLMLAILSDDYTTLGRAPGVGKKTAMRLALELKDKIKTKDAIGGGFEGFEDSKAAVSSGEKQDAVDALVALGYSKGEALKAALEVYLDGMGTADIVKGALKKLSK